MDNIVALYQYETQPADAFCVSCQKNNNSKLLSQLVTYFGNLKIMNQYVRDNVERAGHWVWNHPESY